MSDILPEAASTQPNASKLASRQMSHSIRSWLVPAILQHHKAYGLDLERKEQGHYVQILQFHSHRTPARPHEQIVATVSDKTHRFSIRFDVAATDDYESREGSLGMLSEPLTSHLRTIVRIKSFKFSLLPPKGRQKYDAALPEIILDVLSWDVRSGDRTETVYWPGAREISHNDELAAQVLIEWWGGRDGSPSMTDQVTKEWKARRAAKSPTPEQSLHTPVISQTKTSMFNNYVEGKKTVPAALWTISVDQQQELDMIQCFGLDPVKMAEEEGSDSDAGGEVDDLASQPEKPVAEDEVPWSPSPTPPPRVVERPTPPATLPNRSQHQSAASPQKTATSGPPNKTLHQASHAHHSSTDSLRSHSPSSSAHKLPVKQIVPRQLSDSGSDSDQDLRVRPLSRPNAARKPDQSFDPLAFDAANGISQASQPEPTASLEVEELPGSLASESRLDLANASARRSGPRNVLVADSDREVLKAADTSMESAIQSGGQSQDPKMLELSPTAAAQGSKRKRETSPVVEEEAEISMEADDEDSLPPRTIATPREKPRSRGAFAFINPINLFTSSRPPPASSKVKAQESELRQPSPSLLSRFMPGRQARENESRSGSSVGEEEEQRQEAPSHIVPSDKEAVQPTKRMRQSSHLEKNPTKRLSPAEAQTAALTTKQRRSRLDGFQLNLIPSDGLAEDKVQAMLEQARRARASIKK